MNLYQRLLSAGKIRINICILWGRLESETGLFLKLADKMNIGEIDVGIEE
jgi:hypothetical protein